MQHFLEADQEGLLTLQICRTAYVNADAEWCGKAVSILMRGLEDGEDLRLKERCWAWIG